MNKIQLDNTTFSVFIVLHKNIIGTIKSRRAASLACFALPRNAQFSLIFSCLCHVFVGHPWARATKAAPSCSELFPLTSCHTAQGPAGERQREKPCLGKTHVMKYDWTNVPSFPNSHLWAASASTSVGSAVLSVTSPNRAAKGLVASVSFVGAIFAL